MRNEQIIKAMEDYRSPIEIVYDGFEDQLKDNIINACISYGINVDKDELIKALQYDREQFDKGYKSGYQKVLEEIRAEIMEIDEPSHDFEGFYECQTKVLNIIDKYRGNKND